MSFPASLSWQGSIGRAHYAIHRIHERVLVHIKKTSEAASENPG